MYLLSTIQENIIPAGKYKNKWDTENSSQGHYIEFSRRDFILHSIERYMTHYKKWTNKENVDRLRDGEQDDR